MAKKDNKNHENDNQNDQSATQSNEDTTSVYDTTPEKDPGSADPHEEVTPGNVQAPPDDEAKLKQDNVLNAEHIEKGFPANEVPRTDEEKKQMEQEELI